jgi:metal-responsive CopG/Arc/MetJ family transcriptional regulator
MRMPTVTITMDRECLAEFDMQCQRRGFNRSEAIRLAIDLLLPLWAKEPEAVVARQKELSE